METQVKNRLLAAVALGLVQGSVLSASETF